MKRGAGFWTLGVVCLMAGSLIAWWATSPRRSPPLTAEALKSARARWERSAIRDYEFTIGVGSGEGHRHHVRVEHGKVVSMETDGKQAPERVWPHWSVPGLFDILEEELANRATPQGAFGVSDPRDVFQDAAFDPSTGVPLRYLRQVSGLKNTIAWEIRGFTRR